MIKIAYTYRRAGGRYQYRRKLYLRKIGLLPITWSLRTSEWSVARQRAAAATAALDRVVQTMQYEAFIGVRSASDVKNVLKGVIDLTLGTATQGYFDPTTPPSLVDAACLVNADFHDLAARHGGIAILSDEDEVRLRADGRDDAHLVHLRRLIRSTGGGLVLSDATVQQRLEHLGLKHLPNTVEQDRLLMHRAISEGQRRAACFNHPQVIASGDPLDYLMTHGGMLTAAMSMRDAGTEANGMAPPPPAPATASAPAPAPTTAPVETTASSAASSPLLSELVNDIVAGIVSKGGWSEGVGEDGWRVMKQFIWMIGDKPCLDYTQKDVATFRKMMWDMPKTVRVRSVWYMPYQQAAKKFPKLTAANKRTNKTLNKDLSYISTFTKEMVAVGHWPQDFITPLSLAAIVTRQEKSSGRVPWTPTHIEGMFSSPVYHGCVGPRRRLVSGRDVHHDAAYWMPLLGAYQMGRRDEHAGHLISDFVFDKGTPHMLIQPNALRGLKTADAERVLPIHPRLLELGFEDYVKAVGAKGGKFLFPELWLNGVKKGGDQYYAIGWKKLIDWLRKQPGVTIPRTPAGKEADFHSMRTTGLSQLDRADINQNIVKDIAGHSREGTTACSYQKLLESGGLEDVLQERLKVLTRLPDYAAGVTRRKPSFLPMKARTR